MRRQKLKLGAAISEDRTFGHLLYRVAKPSQSLIILNAILDAFVRAQDTMHFPRNFDRECGVVRSYLASQRFQFSGQTCPNREEGAD